MTIRNSSLGARASRPHRVSPSPLDGQIPGARASRPHWASPPPLDAQNLGARASRPHQASPSPQDAQNLGARASRPHQASPSPQDAQNLGARASRPHQSPPLDGQNLGARASRPRRAWRSRGYLPRIDTPGAVRFVTFRLADSMPGAVLAQWKSELARMSVSMSEYKRSVELRRRIERYLDSGYGACWLRDNRVAQLVEDALPRFDGARYNLPAWVAMPNHVHAMLEVFDGFPLDGAIHSWKSFSAKRANRILGRLTASTARLEMTRISRTRRDTLNGTPLKRAWLNRRAIGGGEARITCADPCGRDARAPRNLHA